MKQLMQCNWGCLNFLPKAQLCEVVINGSRQTFLLLRSLFPNLKIFPNFVLTSGFLLANWVACFCDLLASSFFPKHGKKITFCLELKSLVWQVHPESSPRLKLICVHACFTIVCMVTGAFRLAFVTISLYFTLFLYLLVLHFLLRWTACHSVCCYLKEFQVATSLAQV